MTTVLQYLTQAQPLLAYLGVLAAVLVFFRLRAGRTPQRAMQPGWSRKFHD